MAHCCKSRCDKSEQCLFSAEIKEIDADGCKKSYMPAPLTASRLSPSFEHDMIVLLLSRQPMKWLWVNCGVFMSVWTRVNAVWRLCGGSWETWSLKGTPHMPSSIRPVCRPHSSHFRWQMPVWLWERAGQTGHRRKRPCSRMQRYL